jgi:CPA2 family monovalent cation:H+ antiporter-2
MQIATVFWFSILSLSFFSARYVGIATAVLGVLLFSKLYQRLGATYHWFEEEFLGVFKTTTKSKKQQDIFRQLAPWDEHLVRIKVHADSPFCGQKLQDIELRKKLGLNVVAIQRGSRAIVAPKPNQQIFPKDELLVLGTDEQVDKARPMIENSSIKPTDRNTISGYELRQVPISDKSELLGRSIRQSGIREKFDAMVVGIERRGKRIMNPDSDMVIEIEDRLWVVGASEQLDKLQR